MIAEEKIYDTIGEAGFTRLISDFYRRVKDDDLLGPLYPANDFEAAEVRLREFLIQRFGGPATYSESRGHPRLRMRHAPFPVDRAAADRWLMLMDQSLTETGLPEDVDASLRKYFLDTALFMINRQ